MRIKVDYMNELRRDAAVKVGDVVLCCWTNSGHEWAGKAEVVRLNAKTARCRLLAPVGGPGYYPAGQEIRVPRAVDVANWSFRNCMLEWKEEYAEVR